MKSDQKNKNLEPGQKQENTDIGKVFKGLVAIGTFFLMLMIVIKKISNIKEVNASSWLVLSFFFIVVTLAGVKLSNFIEKKPISVKIPV